MQRIKALFIIAILSLIITGAISSDFIDSELAEMQELSGKSSSFIVKTFTGLTELGRDSMTGMAVSGSNDLVTFRSWKSLATDKSEQSISTGEMKAVTWNQQTTLSSKSEVNSRKSSRLKKSRKNAYIYPLNMSNHIHTLQRGNISFMAVNGLDKTQKLKIKLEALQGIDYNQSVSVELEPGERRVLKVPVSITAGQGNYIFRAEIGTNNNSTFQPSYGRNFILGKISAQIEMYLDGGVKGCVFTPSNHFSGWQNGDWLVSEEKEVCSSRNKEMPVKFEQVNFSTDFRHSSWSDESSKEFDAVLKYRVDNTDVKKMGFNNSKA